jgi:hypothetical protein
MDMQMQPPQQGAQPGAEDPKALLEQARGLIDKALAAMGGEEMAEGDKMAADRQNIAREVFGG